MTTKLVDGKGRLMLGSRFAGRMVIVDESDADRVVITPAVAIPEREAWLYENPKALDLVRAGLKQASQGRFGESVPNLDADAKLAD